MGLGVWFSQDIAHVLKGVGESVQSLAAQRGLQDAADVAYVAGYCAALRAVATCLGLGQEPWPRDMAQIPGPTRRTWEDVQT
ncbi:MAG: hypothetical protein KKA73_09450 [Chloroflexi bacterium]|nr:hypothetical protein [Chloroflexota bacterium]MBU1747902.1 hypothetical protein [Chloroflexota bacterium]